MPSVQLLAAKLHRRKLPDDQWCAASKHACSTNTWQEQHLLLRFSEAAEAPVPFSTSPGAAIRIFCAFDQRSYMPLFPLSPSTCTTGRWHIRL